MIKFQITPSTINLLFFIYCFNKFNNFIMAIIKQLALKLIILKYNSSKKLDHLSIEKKHMMDYTAKVCLSNTAFSLCAMGIFLLTRRQVFLTNAFASRLSPFCSTILKYETQSKINSSQMYMKRLAGYLVLQTAAMYGFKVVSAQINDATKRGNKTVYQLNIKSILPKSQISTYKINPSKLINPVLFCTLFKLPLVFGIGLGLAANHIDANLLTGFVEMFN